MNATSFVTDDLREAIEPLLPKGSPKPKGGRPRIPNRAALAGIVFVLRTGCPWRLLPKELGCGSGATCWRRLRDWQKAGVWQRLHETLLNWLDGEAAIDWSRASLDSLSVWVKKGANRLARTRRIAARSAPSTTSRWTGTASRWRSASRPPTPTTPRSSSHWSTPSRPSSGRAASPAGPASARPNSMPTRRTTLRRSAVPCDLAASLPGLPVAGSTPLSDWGGTAGWWSAHSHGCWVVVDSANATSGGQTCSRGCSTSPVPSSAYASSDPRPGDGRCSRPMILD